MTGKGEDAVIAHFVSGAEESTESRAGKCAADADALYADCGESGVVEWSAAEPRKHVDRAVASASRSTCTTTCRRRFAASPRT